MKNQLSSTGLWDNQARYNPSSYVLPQFVDQYEIKQDAQKSPFDEQSSRESFLIGMMKTNLLKRRECSIESFETTLSRLLGKIDATLAKIKHFANSTQAYEQPDLFDGLEDDELLALREQLEVGSKLKFQLAHLNRELWRQDLQEDRDQLLSLLNNAKAVTGKRDGKLVGKSVPKNAVEEFELVTWLVIHDPEAQK